jgi:PTH1 family peptidyl-tRNA hydrolase
MLFVIAGLGNPGKEYQDSRHNAGFLAAERLAERNGLSLGAHRFEARTAAGSIAGRKVLLLMPQTFMNLSGASVGQACRFFKVPAGQLLVLHDDLDLPLGRIQVRQGGGDGGHKGVRSVLDALGDPGFCRVRVGVGRPPAPEDAVGFVLGGFTREERPLLTEATERAAQAVEVWLREGLVAAMNRFNPWLGGPGPNESEEKKE